VSNIYRFVGEIDGSRAMVARIEYNMLLTQPSKFSERELFENIKLYILLGHSSCEHRCDYALVNSIPKRETSSLGSALFPKTISEL
jgi:hypothetical protein